MNQKNIFTVIAALLILQGLVFFFMKTQIMASAFPAVDATGQEALSHFMEVVAALSILTGLVTYANRTTPGVVWAFSLGHRCSLELRSSTNSWMGLMYRYRRSLSRPSSC